MGVGIVPIGAEHSGLLLSQAPETIGFLASHRSVQKLGQVRSLLLDLLHGALAGPFCPGASAGIWCHGETARR
jgi:hypothetical protein